MRERVEVTVKHTPPDQIARQREISAAWAEYDSLAQLRLHLMRHRALSGTHLLPAELNEKLAANAQRRLAAAGIKGTGEMTRVKYTPPNGKR